MRQLRGVRPSLVSGLSITLAEILRGAVGAPSTLRRMSFVVDHLIGLGTYPSALAGPLPGVMVFVFLGTSFAWYGPRNTRVRTRRT
jgi:hypothetical protein